MKSSQIMVPAPFQTDRSVHGWPLVHEPATGSVVLQMASTPPGGTRRRSGGGVAEPFAPAPHGTDLSDFATWNPSEILSWPALFMSTSAAIDDQLLRRALRRL